MRNKFISIDNLCLLSALNPTFDRTVTVGSSGTFSIFFFFGNLSGLGKVTIADIEPALSYCTHLVYGFAGINENKRVISQNANQDLDQAKGSKNFFLPLKLGFKLTFLRRSICLQNRHSAEEEVPRPEGSSRRRR